MFDRHRGGMATVFKAHDPTIGRDVAIKFLHASLCEGEDYRGRFLQEARTATSWRRRASQYAIFMLELLSARLATANYAPSPEEGRAYGVRGVLTCGATAKDAGPVIAEPSPPAVLFVGTWEGRKRGRLLADAFRRDVRPFFPDAELWMVSDRAEPAPGVRWFENPSDDTVAELYERATVMCLPSAYEGLGIPYIEAIAAGTPVVATPNPGAEWVLENGRVGRIVAAADVGAALRELLADPQAREALAAAGRRRARDFAWDAVCAAHIAAYSDAIVDFGARRRSAGSHRSFRRRKYRSTTT